MLVGSNFSPLLFAGCIQRTADVGSVEEYFRSKTGEDSSTIEEGKISHPHIYVVIYVINLTPMADKVRPLLALVI